MKKIAIAVTSTSGVDHTNLKNDINLIRLTVHFDGKDYVDHTELKADDFYEMINEKPNADVKTSQAATGKVAELYENLKDQGYTDVIVVTISSKLSGSYQGCVTAATLVEGINVHVIDSKSASYGETLLAAHALKLAKENVEPKIIVEKLEEIRDNVNIYLLVDTLKYLVKNGRLSHTSGALGTLLKIKPILTVENGVILPLEKVRTTKKAREKLLELSLEKIKETKEAEAFIAYTDNKDLAETFENEILKHYPNLKITLIPLTPVVGAHTGPGAIGIGLIKYT